MPLIVACSYASVVLCLFFIAVVALMTGQDEFGYSATPALYATCPLSLFLEHKALNWFLAAGAGAGVNSVFLYALLWIAVNAKSLRGAI